MRTAESKIVDASIGELRVASGKSIKGVVADWVYRMISFHKITVKDDSDWFTHGEFIFHALVNGKSAGRSKVVYANTGEFGRYYVHSLAIRHFPVKNDDKENPLILQLKVDELERVFPNERIMDETISFTGDDGWGLGDRVFESEALVVEYKVEDLSEDDYNDVSFIQGTVKAAHDDSPIENAWLTVRKNPSGEFVKRVKTNASGDYRIEGLAGETEYRLKIEARGYASVMHEFEGLHWDIDVSLSKLFMNGEVKSGLKSIEDARIDLHETMIKVVKKRWCYKKSGFDTTTPVSERVHTSQLDVGDYEVLEVKRGPADGADYVKLKADSLPPGEGWIVSRWKDTHLGLLYDKKIEDSVTSDSSGDFRIEATGWDQQLHMVRAVKKGYFDGESPRVLPTAGKKANVPNIKMRKSENLIPEASIIDLLDKWEDYNYSLDQVWYPYDLPDCEAGVNLPANNAQKKTNCCTFVEGLLVKAVQNNRPDFKWDNDKHKKSVITPLQNLRNDKYSPVTVMVEEGVAERLDDVDSAPPPWTIVQGWTDDPNKKAGGVYVYASPPPPSGHTFIVVAVHPESQRVLMLEASSGLGGVGFRKLKKISEYSGDDYCPGKHWWKNENLWKWSKFKNRWKFRGMARLRVYDLKWVK